MRHLFHLLKSFASIAILASVGCDKRNSPLAAVAPENAGGSARATEAPKQTAVYSYEVVNAFPHDAKAFTQGLLFRNGVLFESTGLNGQSTLRKVDLKTGKVLKHIEVPSEYFAEGLAVFGGKLFQLTWKHGKGFVYDLESFQLEREFTYQGEGWGLTADDQSLILSDGTDHIRFIEPSSFKVKRTINVTNCGQPVARLNELEYVEGEILANVWGTDYVVRINPLTGTVTGIVDFRNLLPASDRNGTDVLNGIAYDHLEKRLFVTGKWWPKIFEVRLKARQ
jgi:glutamine cyclotransferase